MFEAYAEDDPLGHPQALLAIQKKLNQTPHRTSANATIFPRDAIEVVLGRATLH
jgi:hypothetical protein